MKRVFPHIGRRLRLFLAAFLKLSLLFFPAEGRCAEAARPAQGFIMDMAPLLGDNGRISAIAPGCRAMTGIMDGEAILWSRDFGLLRVVLPEDQYGMGNFLSDDGRSMAGFVSSRRDQPSPGVVWSRPGFLWRYDGTRQPMSRHGLEDVVWYGMSADGRVALGYGKKPIPGAPAADAPFEEHARFAQTPEGKAARNRGFLTHSEFWFCIEDGQRFRRMDEMGTIVTSPYFRVLSRDGKKILDKKDNVVHIVDRQTGRDRILRFGGAAPFRGGNLLHTRAA